MDIGELVMSILANGFFESEALYIVKEEGRYVVIEGNRRLAAVKESSRYLVRQNPHHAVCT